MRAQERRSAREAFSNQPVRQHREERRNSDRVHNQRRLMAPTVSDHPWGQSLRSPRRTDVHQGRDNDHQRRTQLSAESGRRGVADRVSEVREFLRDENQTVSIRFLHRNILEIDDRRRQTKEVKRLMEMMDLKAVVLRRQLSRDAAEALKEDLERTIKVQPFVENSGATRADLKVAFVVRDQRQSYKYGKNKVKAQENRKLGELGRALSAMAADQRTNDVRFNVASIIRYRGGRRDRGLGAHEDTEKGHKDEGKPFIASVSVGQEATFALYIGGECIEMALEDGDILFFYGNVRHAVHKTGERWNVTYREFVPIMPKGRMGPGWNDDMDVFGGDRGPGPRQKKRPKERYGKNKVTRTSASEHQSSDSRGKEKTSGNKRARMMTAPAKETPNAAKDGVSQPKERLADAEDGVSQPKERLEDARDGNSRREERPVARKDDVSQPETAKDGVPIHKELGAEVGEEKATGCFGFRKIDVRQAWRQIRLTERSEAQRIRMLPYYPVELSCRIKRGNTPEFYFPIDNFEEFWYAITTQLEWIPTPNCRRASRLEEDGREGMWRWLSRAWTRYFEIWEGLRRLFSSKGNEPLLADYVFVFAYGVKDVEAWKPKLGEGYKPIAKEIAKDVLRVTKFEMSGWASRGAVEVANAFADVTYPDGSQWKKAVKQVERSKGCEKKHHLFANIIENLRGLRNLHFIPAVSTIMIKKWEDGGVKAGHEPWGKRPEDMQSPRKAMPWFLALFYDEAGSLTSRSRPDLTRRLCIDGKTTGLGPHASSVQHNEGKGVKKDASPSDHGISDDGDHEQRVLEGSFGATLADVQTFYGTIEEVKRADADFESFREKLPPDHATSGMLRRQGFRTKLTGRDSFGLWVLAGRQDWYVGVASPAEMMTEWIRYFKVMWRSFRKRLLSVLEIDEEILVSLGYEFLVKRGHTLQRLGCDQVLAEQRLLSPEGILKRRFNAKYIERIEAMPERITMKTFTDAGVDERMRKWCIYFASKLRKIPKSTRLFLPRIDAFFVWAWEQKRAKEVEPPVWAVAFWRANGGLLGERSPEGFYAYWKAVFAADMGQETKASEKGSSGRAEEKTNKGGREDCNSWGRYDQNALDFGSVEEHPSWKAADEAKRN